jgi:hypothetical protein
MGDKSLKNKNVKKPKKTTSKPAATPPPLGRAQ